MNRTQVKELKKLAQETARKHAQEKSEPPELVKFNIPDKLIGEMAWSGGVMEDSGFPAVVRDAYRASKRRKQGRGYTNIFEVDRETARAILAEMYSSADGFTFGVDPDCAANNRAILRLVAKVRKQYRL